MTRTGVYGGSFNPIHEGHTRLAHALIDEGLVDEVWLLVSPQNPLKARADLLDDAARLRLARLGATGLHVSDFEMRRPRPSYMVDTLAALRHAYPEREFVLVIGADNWQAFDRWREPETIRAHHDIVVYPRPGYPLPHTLPKGVIAAQTPLIDLSSTAIRRRIATDPAYRGEGLCPEVWGEIKRCGYYR